MRFFGDFVETGVVKIVGEETSHEVFEGEVVDAADVVVVVSGLGFHVTFDDSITYGVACGNPPVALFCNFLVTSEGKFEVVFDGGFDIFDLIADVEGKIVGFGFLHRGRVRVTPYY